MFKKPAPFLIDRVLKNEQLKGEYDRTNVWEIQPETRGFHPAPFPESLAEKCIRYYSYIQEIVFDPFMGSGTTAKMAYQCQRFYLGFEISQEYIDIANERLRQRTLFEATQRAA